MIRLRTNIDGNYILVCPSCGHEHHRQIRKGAITSDRCNFVKNVDRIIVPKAAYRKTPIVEEKQGNREESKVIRSDLWARFAGRRQ